MKLYFCPGSRAVRSAWLLFELDVDFELHRFERLGDPAMRTPEYLALNPNGRIPTLEDDGQIISESTAIAQYIAARYGQGRLVPEVTSPDYGAYLQWLHYAEGMIMPPMNNYVVETILLKPERRSEEHANRALKLMNRTLQAVDAQLEGRDYLIGDFTVADTITGHACVMCAKFGVDMSALPNVKAYVDRLNARPALQKAFAL